MLRTQLKDEVTVVVTTSPLAIHPNVTLVSHTVRSLRHATGMLRCRLLIVCDGVKVKEKNKYRSGEVTKEMADNYKVYISRLKRLSQDPRSPLYKAELMTLEERQGFGFALKAAILTVTTPYVLVVQHDRDFCRDVNMNKIVGSMKRHPELK